MCVCGSTWLRCACVTVWALVLGGGCGSRPLFTAFNSPVKYLILWHGILGPGGNERASECGGPWSTTNMKWLSFLAFRGTLGSTWQHVTPNTYTYTATPTRTHLVHTFVHGVVVVAAGFGAVVVWLASLALTLCSAVLCFGSSRCKRDVARTLPRTPTSSNSGSRVIA